MEFAKIIKYQATYKFLHVGSGIGRKDQQDLSCRTCYPIKDQLKHERFDRFWKLIKQMDLKAGRYSGQTIFAFNKLIELSFKKDKSHNVSLIAEIRAILTILKYN